MSIIKPIVLPKAAGENFAELDVRHLALGDSMDNATIARATRNLAERDNAVGDKLNEVLAVVNNKEQFVNLPTSRMTLPALGSEVITNYRIPPGFEARVLNAVVSSTPPGQGKLEVLYGTSFGGVTGDIILSTQAETTADTKFYPEVDLIIKITNVGSAAAEVVSSLILTMRPLTDAEGSIVGAGVTGPPGIQGIPGGVGPAGGSGGTGPQGPKGLVWRGPYNPVTSYFKDDAVNTSFPAAGTWAFIATVDNVGTPPTMAGVAPWNVLASAGSTLRGPTGAPGSGPLFSTQTTFGTIYTQGDYVAAATDAGYLNLPAGTNLISMQEVVAKGGATPSGLAMITSHQQLKYRGTVTVKLPTVAKGASSVDYSLPYTVIDASGTGTVLINKISPGAFDMNIPGSVPHRVNLGITAIQPIP